MKTEEITVREYLKRNLHRRTLPQLAVDLKVPHIGTAQLNDTINTVRVTESGMLAPDKSAEPPKPKRKTREYPKQTAPQEQFKLTDAPVEPPTAED